MAWLDEQFVRGRMTAIWPLGPETWAYVLLVIEENGEPVTDPYELRGCHTTAPRATEEDERRARVAEFRAVLGDPPLLGMLSGPLPWGWLERPAGWAADSSRD